MPTPTRSFTRAKLSPVLLTQKLDDAQWKRLYDATQRDAATLDRSPRRDGGRRLSRTRHRVSRRIWPCTAATASPVPSAAKTCSAFAMRITKPTTARVPDRRPASGRSRAVAPVEIRLAAHPRGTRSPQTWSTSRNDRTAKARSVRRAILVIYPRKVSLCFLYGARLADPERRLAGGGKQVRHISWPA